LNQNGPPSALTPLKKLHRSYAPGGRWLEWWVAARRGVARQLVSGLARASHMNKIEYENEKLIFYWNNKTG
ncbi:hypothetical protein M2C68_22665, partial [Pseudomonas sp. BAgro211]|nr:hypothetical protein [Pseudomonas sp. BAgro211]